MAKNHIIELAPATDEFALRCSCGKTATHQVGNDFKCVNHLTDSKGKRIKKSNYVPQNYYWANKRDEALELNKRQS